MLKWSVASLCVTGLLAAAPSLCAGQALPVERREFGGHLQAGVGLLYLRPDYMPSNNFGITGYIDADINSFIGAEATGHFGGLESPADISENSYLGGPRAIYRKHNAAAYGKFLFGYGTITNQHTRQSSGFSTYAWGAGLEYKVKTHYNIRIIDFEQQKWPDYEPHTLSPIVLTVGLAYVFR